MNLLRQFRQAVSALLGPVEPPPPKPSLDVVGTGADNEVQVEIAGVPHLFVKEPDRIVHFVPSFAHHLKGTRFGQKLLPDLVPHWTVAGTHTGKLEDVVAEAIRQNSRSPHDSSPVTAGDAAKRTSLSNASEAPTQLSPAPQSTARQAEPARASYRGHIASWGEQRFPDRKRPGKTYASFALNLETTSGTEVLQGEGLKDALSEASAEVGQLVEVRRLKKIKVPAHTRSGEPKVDDQGNPILWDKWLWSISHAH